MGEPLDNARELALAVEALTDEKRFIYIDIYMYREREREREKYFYMCI